MVWGGVLWKLAGGLGERLATPQAGFIVSWVFDASVAQMFQDHPPTLAAYFVAAAWATPLFGMLAACDQTATDIGTRHIRYLIPRVGRAEIFVARLLGASIVMSCAQLLAGTAATIIAIVLHSGGEISTGAIVAYGAEVTGLLIVYSLPIVALMSFVSAAMASVGLALLVGVGGYVLLLIPGWMLTGKAGTVLSFLVPGGLKPYLLQAAPGPSLAACAGALAYVALYVSLGWLVFRRRDA